MFFRVEVPKIIAFFRAHPPKPWCIDIAIFVLLLTATCFVYAGDLDLGFFNLDDPDYVVNNAWIQSLSAANVGHILTEPLFANYSPLHILSYSLDYAIAGKNPYVFHWSNNVWAGLVAGFVYLVSLSLMRKRLVALAAGALFVVHPAHVEAVAWISSRKDLVATAFALPAMLAYLYYRNRKRPSTAPRKTPRSRMEGSGARLPAAAGRPKRKAESAAFSRSSGSETQIAAAYLSSLFLFTLAIAAKQSVVVLPVIFIAFDFFIEGRKGREVLLDKIPFVIVAIFFALRTIGAQPSTGYQLDLFTIGQSLAKSVWLLTGFGDYVLYRPRPDPDVANWVRISYAVFPFVALALLFVLRRRIHPLPLTLVFWIILALIPSQVLSFVHPVTDRYLFFPSVAAVLLLAWIMFWLYRQGGRAGRVVAVLFLVGLAGTWARTTLAYLQEWRDPRSVWFAASKKSSEVDIYSYLGTHYQESASLLDRILADNAPIPDQLRRLAERIWADDPRLGPLLAEWQSGASKGPRTREFQKHLLELAWSEFEQAVRVRRGRIVPNLYFRRGKIEMDRGNLEQARHEFQSAYELAQQHTYPEERRQFAVRCHYALGIVAWKAHDYPEALRWIRTAEEEQTRFGGSWVPELSQSRARLEMIIRARAK